MSDETKHSPEPWRALTNGSGPHAILSATRPVRDAVIVGCRSGLKSADDARRIVACVNACAGIPTEALEAGALAVATEALSHIMGRDGLVEATDGAFALQAFRRCQEQARYALRALGRLP